MLSKKYRIAFLSMALILLLPLIACADPNPAGSATETSDVPAASEAESTAAGTGTEAHSIGTDTEFGTDAPAVGSGFTVELTQTEYSVSDTALTFVLRSADGRSFITRGNTWILLKEENGERVIVGKTRTEEIIEHSLPYEGSVSVKLLGLDGLTEGVYYLQYVEQEWGDENGEYHYVPGCDLRLTVK